MSVSSRVASASSTGSATSAVRSTGDHLGIGSWSVALPRSSTAAMSLILVSWVLGNWLIGVAFLDVINVDSLLIVDFLS